MKDLTKQYDQIGKDYVAGQTSFFANKEDKAITFIKSQVNNLHGKTILDVGCGHGKDIKSYMSMGAERIYGIDSSSFMVDAATKNVGAEVNLSVQNIEKTNFPNNHFDIVVSRYAMHYLSSLDAAYREIARVLKDKGKLIIVVPHPFRDLVQQKHKIYGKKEMIGVKLFNSGVVVNYPTHTISDYLSKIFLQHFSLVCLHEDPQSDEYEKDAFATPGFIGLSAIKR